MREEWDAAVQPPIDEGLKQIQSLKKWVAEAESIESRCIEEQEKLRRIDKQASAAQKEESKQQDIPSFEIKEQEGMRIQQDHEWQMNSAPGDYRPPGTWPSQE